jgi:transcriptional regulator with XRE-family HTH domain
LELKIGQIARSIRIEKGIKQSFVSEKLGFKSHSSYSEIESGKRNLPSDKIPILAQTLGVSVEELFFGKEIRNSRTMHFE